MLRILIADDHDVIRRGLRDIITAQPGWVVCGEARNGMEAVTRATKLAPDIAILDFQMPNLNGIEAARQIQRECPRIEILMISADCSEEFIHIMITARIRGFVHKRSCGSELVAAVRALRNHKPYFTAVLMENLIDNRLAIGTATGVGKNLLTARETEVLLLVAEGKSNREIGLTLNISQRTIDTHRTNLMRKLNVHSTSDLVRYALRNKLVEA